MRFDKAGSRWKRDLLRAILLTLAAPSLLAGAEIQLSGTVVSSAGGPVDGAELSVTTPNSEAFRRTGRTNAKGRFAMKLGPEGWIYSLRIEKPGFSAAVTQIRVPVGRPIVDISATLVVAPAAGAPAPDAATASYREGLELLKKGDRTGAEQKFNEAVVARPDLAEAWFELGRLAYDRKDYHAAGAAFARIVQMKRDWADPYYWFAMSQFNLTRYPESRSLFQRYLELAPQGSQAASAREMLKGLAGK